MNLYAGYDIDQSFLKGFDHPAEKKIRSRLDIREGDYLAVTSDDDRIFFRKARIEVDYENPDDAWKEYSAQRFSDE